MLARMIGALTSITRHVVQARLVAVLCAVAILVAGFGHSIHHLGAPILNITAQIDAGGSDDSSPDRPKIAPAAIEHCLGCVAIVVANPAQLIVPHPVAAGLAMPIVDEVWPHTSVVEIPPPISAI